MFSLIIFLLYFESAFSSSFKIETFEEQKVNISRKFGPQDIYVTHYDCSPHSDTQMEYYTLNKIAPCKISPDEIEHTPVRVNVYAKARAREFRAFKLKVIIQRQVVTCREIANHRRADFLNFYNATIPLPHNIEQSELRDHLIRLRLLAPPQAYQNLSRSVNFSLLADRHLQSKLEAAQGFIGLDPLNPYALVHGKLIYDETDDTWIPHINSKTNPEGNCKGWSHGKSTVQKLVHLSYSIQLERITLNHLLKDGSLAYKGIKLYCNQQHGFCRPSVAVPATIVWQPTTACTLYAVTTQVGKMLKFDNRYFIETLSPELNLKYDFKDAPDMHKTYTMMQRLHAWHRHKLLRVEIYNEQTSECLSSNATEIPDLYKTQYDEIFIRYKYGFDMNTGKVNWDRFANDKNDLVHNKYFNATVDSVRHAGTDTYRNKLVPSADDQKILEREKLSLLFKEKDADMNESRFGELDFGAIHDDINDNMKMDYIVSRVFWEMDMKDLEIYRNLCELERKVLLQTLVLATQHHPLLGFIITGDRSAFINLESPNTVSLKYCAQKFSQLYVFDPPVCYEHIPIYYNNRVHFVDHVTRQTLDWSRQTTCDPRSTDQLIPLDPDSDGDWYRLTPFPIKTNERPKQFSPHTIHAAHTTMRTAQHIGLYNQADLQRSYNKQKFRRWFEESSMQFIVQPSQNQKMIARRVGYGSELEEVERLNNFLQTFYMNGREYVLKQVKLADFFNASWLKTQLIDIFGTPWYYYNQMAQIYVTIQMTFHIYNFACKTLHGFNLQRYAPPHLGFLKVFFHGITGTFSKSAYTMFYQNTDPIVDPDKNASKSPHDSDSSSSSGAPRRNRVDRHRRCRSVSYHRSRHDRSPDSTSEDYVQPLRSNYPRKVNTYAEVDDPRTSTPIYSPPPVHYDKLHHTVNIDAIRNINYHPMHRH